MRDERERLRDILEAIAQVEKYATRGRATFERDLPDLKIKVEAILKAES